ncbi:MAG: hypothetical protein Q8R37_05830 [Nanoarchaeota archaeon]|nr:hypothetical protein [Nanoarchaeota archaeon]
MSLDDLLAPVKWADEQVLRQYTKLTQTWEKKGRSKYSLAHILNGSSIVCFGFTNEFYSEDIPNLFLLVGPWQGYDFARGLIESSFKKDVTDGPIAKDTIDFIIDIYKAFTVPTRFPALTAGITLLGKGIVELIDYIKNKNTASLSDSLFSLSLGYSFFGTASSIYIKDSNPKLLDKAPFWKNAIDYVKEKVMSAPQPVPVQDYTPIPKNI